MVDQIIPGKTNQEMFQSKPRKKKIKSYLPLN